MLPSSHSLIPMALSTFAKVGAGPIAVSPLYSPYNPQLNALRPFQGLPTDPIQIKSISVFPDPPEPGRNLTVTVEATAQEEVDVRLHTQVPYIPDHEHIFSQEGAYADVTVKVGLIKLLQKQFDLCEEAYVFVTLAV
jgi:hypothetical protein